MSSGGEKILTAADPLRDLYEEAEKELKRLQAEDPSHTRRKTILRVVTTVLAVASMYIVLELQGTFSFFGEPPEQQLATQVAELRGINDEKVRQLETATVETSALSSTITTLEAGRQYLSETATAIASTPSPTIPPTPIPTPIPTIGRITQTDVVVYSLADPSLPEATAIATLMQDTINIYVCGKQDVEGKGTRYQISLYRCHLTEPIGWVSADFVEVIPSEGEAPEPPAEVEPPAGGG
jgi:hypothetical protein